MDPNHEDPAVEFIALMRQAVAALNAISASLKERAAKPAPSRPVYFSRNGQPLMIDADLIDAIRHAGGSSEGKAIVCFGSGRDFGGHPIRPYWSDFVDESPAEAIELWKAALAA